MTAVRYGPLSRLPEWPPDINAHLLLRGVWLGVRDGSTLARDPDLRAKHLRAVAAAANAVPATAIAAVHRRRLAAARGLLRRRGRGYAARALLIRPQWRVVVGHGEDSVQDTSLTLSPSYGVPMWPASGLKGLAAAHARSVLDADRVRRLFGAPRPGEPDVDGRGAVTILDALPDADPRPRVVVDVLTPHVKPYYDEANDDHRTLVTPPAEYHNPVPVQFLAVEGGAFRTLLLGPPSDVDDVVELLRDAADQLGIGGKTSAGYGYCHVKAEEIDP
ncbi:type III-B CRISPR module RAMP protein Cmr6 [Gandjariella thermophila]|uniref:CRISPR type III-associated protein domain-containing protein n=1 Tax=Gandjariella thermophila TaxID=1931992 RepID=A0A4D4J2S1_9PSEU|nr:type III-B CRISPR module RAMP protein Cmr6 [Gandjariella thermophila]GDY29088.1 hypothetical protein GTS_07210 [Gandjariella thermophila]